MSAGEKRYKAQPTSVKLAVCPGCGKRGVPEPSQRGYKFCLRCNWTEGLNVPREETQDGR